MAASSLPPKLTIDGDARGFFLQTPKATSAASSLCHSTAHCHPRKHHDDTRKRAREESYTTSERATPLSESGLGWTAVSSAIQTQASPAPLVNSRYDLANGLDTPTTATSTTLDRSTSFSDLKYRHGHWNTDLEDSTTSYFPSAPNPLARERNGHPRVPKAQDFDPGAPWTMSLLSAVSSVASKVISFCTTAPFRGFYSGGGRGYALSTATLDGESSQPLGGSWHAVGTPDLQKTSSLPSIPGLFPSDNFIPDYMSSPSAHTQERESRSSRKHKRECSTESASQERWVLVAEARTHSPLPVQRPASRAGMRRLAASPRLNLLGGHSPASTAALRSPASTPKRIRLTRESDDDNLPRKPGTPGQQNRVGEDPPVRSPVAMEARRYAAKVKRKEAEENRELKKLNARLKDMIREGNEALGTRVSVDMIPEDDSDGW